MQIDRERTPGPPGDDDVFGVAQVLNWAGFVLRAPLRHRRLAITAFAVVLVLTVVAVRVFPFKYRVDATLLAQRSALMGTLSNPSMNRDWDAPARAAREVLLRHDNLVALCKSTDLVNRYLANRSPLARARDWLTKAITGRDRDPGDVLEGLVDTLETRLFVNVNTEGVVTLSFKWSNPEIALDVVQAALQSFLEARYASEIRTIGETITILETHSARIRGEIATSITTLEKKERELRIRPGTRRPPVTSIQLADEETARLEATLAARQRAAADLEALRQQRISELQSQLAQQQTIYASGHPILASTRRALESLQGPSPQIEELRKESAELTKEIRSRGGRTSDLAGAARDEIDAARIRLESEDPRLEYERRQLTNLLREQANLLERIDSARVEMDTAEAAFKHRYSVIAPPQLPRGPDKPYGILIVAAGILGGLGMAFFASAAADVWAGRVVERWQVEQNLGLTVFGETRR